MFIRIRDLKSDTKIKNLSVCRSLSAAACQFRGKRAETAGSGGSRKQSLRLCFPPSLTAKRQAPAGLGAREPPAAVRRKSAVGKKPQADLPPDTAAVLYVFTLYENKPKATGRLSALQLNEIYGSIALLMRYSQSKSSKEVFAFLARRARLIAFLPSVTSSAP